MAVALSVTWIYAFIIGRILFVLSAFVCLHVLVRVLYETDVYSLYLFTRAHSLNITLASAETPYSDWPVISMQYSWLVGVELLRIWLAESMKWLLSSDNSCVYNFAGVWHASRVLFCLVCVYCVKIPCFACAPCIDVNTLPGTRCVAVLSADCCVGNCCQYFTIFTTVWSISLSQTVRITFTHTHVASVLAHFWLMLMSPHCRLASKFQH